MLPELHIAIPEIHLRLHETRRIGHHLLGHVEKGLADIERPLRLRGAVFVLAGDEIRDEPLAPRRHAGKFIGLIKALPGAAATFVLCRQGVLYADSGVRRHAEKR